LQGKENPIGRSLLLVEKHHSKWSCQIKGNVV